MDLLLVGACLTILVTLCIVGLLVLVAQLRLWWFRWQARRRERRAARGRWWR